MPSKINWIGTTAVAVFLVLLVGAYLWRSFQPGAFSGNSAYRLTADAVVDGRTVSASEVYSYSCSSWRNGGAKTEAVGVPCMLTGQALHLDLGKRGVLFVTMNGWTADHAGFSGEDMLVHQLLFAEQKGHAIPPALMPVMVRFDDLDDPATARVVDPAHLDRTFGPNAALIALTIQPAAPQLPAGDIDAALPWLKRLNGRYLSTRPGDLVLRLHDYDFKWPPK